MQATISNTGESHSSDTPWLESSPRRSGKLVPIKYQYSTLGSSALTHIKPYHFIKLSCVGSPLPPPNTHTQNFLVGLLLFYKFPFSIWGVSKCEGPLTLQLPPTVGRSNDQLLSIHFLCATHSLTISSLCCSCSILQSSGLSLLLIMDVLYLFTHS